MKEAINLVSLEYAKDYLDLHRIKACLTTNERSKGVLLACI